jgi:hypothetical protein
MGIMDALPLFPRNKNSMDKMSIKVNITTK